MATPGRVFPRLHMEIRLKSWALNNDGKLFEVKADDPVLAKQILFIAMPLDYALAANDLSPREIRDASIEIGFSKGWKQPDLGEMHAFICVGKTLYHRDQRGTYVENHTTRLQHLLGQSGKYVFIFHASEESVTAFDDYFKFRVANPVADWIPGFDSAGSGSIPGREENCLAFSLSALYPHVNCRFLGIAEAVAKLKLAPHPSEDVSPNELSDWVGGQPQNPETRVAAIGWYGPQN